MSEKTTNPFVPEISLFGYQPSEDAINSALRGATVAPLDQPSTDRNGQEIRKEKA